MTFKGILEELDARLHLAEVFRRRLTELPGGLHRPYWVDDPDFDLEYHVRHIGLPQPGDWRQLCIQVARLHARQVDLRRPPWEITVIEGLNAVPGVPKGSFAMALKLHHCAVDGIASVQMIAALHDLAADGPRPPGPDHPWQPAPLPSSSELLARTAANAVLHPVRAGRVVASSAPQLVRGLAGLPAKLVGGVLNSVSDGGPAKTLFPPRTRFNQTVSPHRVFEARFHDLADFKRIKARVPGATVNDVALAYVGGALRAYLDQHGELPDESLVAACPISLRDATDASGGGNMLYGRLQALGTDIADPLQRLAGIAESTAGSRSDQEHTTRTQMLELVATLPTVLLGVTAKAASVLPFSGPTVANTTVTNVPGPTEPIYFRGARLLRAAGLGPLIGGLNLCHVVASYNGTLCISATADRDALPDPARYAECMDGAFAELLAAAS
ncbi:MULTISPECIES: WS/DGAT/MGAT family O-acyltransferase [Mycobacterium]|uniref:Diacylglycerol O-acyltransferase n=3 Tax=Mycobacterium kiyosense TaxID=2871094 RepID=A0A9P3Q3P9_9MYCO|nr:MULTISPECIES: wax ester/triacylglycerol synthase family O-acyltransferase [Mycobacterium]BDE14033.1 putative diacyglycerol O-acyltransferase [Mycobacterium sp. 20KCMC460]GLB81211.1 putative diacyglycerol O-acyltransferase [Mycobacterium kiyosense]GLB88241.1 putative diacyglycerol O-acyltransferase [Mycobacterium kiyosense]GLB94547.1 putative diacyglycerol O-acyltransferase [Mycobacterium kiyosense]GLC05665.1 putative diacyglycerol O-acyltransferase [Mycobacterium kiyosense]